ncbi:conserved hypothetical protein (plasmid) [Rhodococcus jostii RHA1]|uniref:Uncharacterized protein n=1 Tax=Rhodococcus jostii (strain RHA1) TaxID=101510 RepID=Q0RXJ4_RHOJR|nr:conserved hypothetical protein [Rhodococcus jostii RHA1]
MSPCSTSAIRHSAACVPSLSARTESGGRDGSPILGSGNIHASFIGGGEAIASYLVKCTISIERRGPADPLLVGEFHRLRSAAGAHKPCSPPKAKATRLGSHR